MAKRPGLPAFSAGSLLMLGSGQLVVALGALLYGKLTALYIPPAEWGQYGLLLAGMTVVHGFFITPTLQSAKAALAQFSQELVIGFYSRVLMRIYLTVALGTALLAGLYLRNPVVGLIWVAAVGQGVYQFGNDYLNALGRHQLYTAIQIGYTLVNVLIFSCLVIGFKTYTAAGLWQSLALLNTLFASLAIWHLTRRRQPDAPLAIKTSPAELMRAYGHYIGPLLSLAFWNGLINYADRFLIRLYLTDADVGQYTMGYTIGSKLLVLVAPLLAFLSPRVLQLRRMKQPPETANSLLTPYLLGYLLVAGIACLVFYIGHNGFGQLLLSDRYKPAFLIGPIVATGYLFLTSIHLLEVKWYTFSQTRFILWHHVAGALLNIGLNLVLIPWLGSLGAALATLLGFAGQFLLVLGLFFGVNRTRA